MIHLCTHKTLMRLVFEDTNEDENRKDKSPASVSGFYLFVQLPWFVSSQNTHNSRGLCLHKTLTTAAVCVLTKRQQHDSFVGTQTRANPDSYAPPSPLPYSLFKLFTGFISAALILWKLTVKSAMAIARNPARAKTHQLICV